MTKTETRTPSEPTYNGWKNYSTWNIALWFSNDQDLYNKWIMVSKILVSLRGGTLNGNGWESGIANYFAGLEIMAHFGRPATPDGVEITDKTIDWAEIAQSWNEDMKDYDWNEVGTDEKAS